MGRPWRRRIGQGIQQTFQTGRPARLQQHHITPADLMGYGDGRGVYLVPFAVRLRRVISRPSASVTRSDST
jgi:hypothetical protein